MDKWGLQGSGRLITKIWNRQGYEIDSQEGEGPSAIIKSDRLIKFPGAQESNHFTMHDTSKQTKFKRPS